MFMTIELYLQRAYAKLNYLTIELYLQRAYAKLNYLK